jgi:hypothetical protein
MPCLKKSSPQAGEEDDEKQSIAIEGTSFEVDGPVTGIEVGDAGDEACADVVLKVVLDGL